MKVEQKSISQHFPDLYTHVAHPQCLSPSQRSSVECLHRQSLDIYLKACKYTVAEHNETKKRERNLMDTRQIWVATLLNITIPKFEVPGRQSPFVFGQKYPECFHLSTTKVSEPLTKERRRQKAYRRPSETHGSYRRNICPCLFGSSTARREWLLATLAIKRMVARPRPVVPRPVQPFPQKIWSTSLKQLNFR